MTDSTSAPALSREPTFGDLAETSTDHGERIKALEEEWQRRLATPPQAKPGLLKTNGGRYSKEKVLGAFLTFAPLILELLPALGVPGLESNPTFHLLITTLGASQWRKRYQRDAPAA